MTRRDSSAKSDTDSGVPQRTPRASGDRRSSTGVFILPPGDIVTLETELETLLEGTQARCALVLDRTGVILAHSGDFHPISPQVMGATAAGVIGALNTMVSRAASPEISVRFYGAEVDRIHFVLLKERMILTLLLGKNSLSGNVRSGVKSFQQKIDSVLQRYRPDQKEAEELQRSVGFIESKLDDMFRIGG